MIFGGYQEPDDNNIGSYPIYEIYRMIPRGTHYYFISLCDGPFKYDPSSSHIPREELMKSKTANLPINPDGSKDISFLPDFVNLIEIENISPTELALGTTLCFSKNALPRVKNSEAFKKIKIWTPLNSIVVSEIRNHDRNHNNSCHMHDWYKYKNVKKLSKDVNATSHLENSIRKNYNILKDIHVEYSCKYSSELFFMANGAFSEFLANTNILDKYNDVPTNSDSITFSNTKSNN
jgi:hypothetical protein